MKILRFVLPEESTIRVGQLLDETILEYPLDTDLLDVLQSKKEPPRKCPEHRLSDVGLVMPFAPKTIYGIGLNYPSHPLKEAFGQIEKPAVPVIFLKGACAAAGLPTTSRPWPGAAASSSPSWPIWTAAGVRRRRGPWNFSASRRRTAAPTPSGCPSAPI